VRDYIPVLHRYGCTLDRLFKWIEATWCTYRRMVTRRCDYIKRL